jgi:hypothetical protein
MFVCLSLSKYLILFYFVSAEAKEEDQELELESLLFTWSTRQKFSLVLFPLCYQDVESNSMIVLGLVMS